MEENEAETTSISRKIWRKLQWNESQILCPQSVDELNKFEEVPMSMIKNIDFRNIHGKF